MMLIRKLDSYVYLGEDEQKVAAKIEIHFDPLLIDEVQAEREIQRAATRLARELCNNLNDPALGNN